MPPDSSTNARMPVVVQSDPADHLDPSLAGLEPYVHSRSSRVEGELGCLSPELLPPHQLPSLPVEWDESKQMRELVSRCPRGPGSGADVGREVLAGEGGAGGEEVGGGALEDDPAAVVAGAGAQVDDPVGVRHDRLVVLDDDDRLAGVDEPVEQAEQLLDVGEVQAGGAWRPRSTCCPLLSGIVHRYIGESGRRVELGLWTSTGGWSSGVPAHTIALPCCCSPARHGAFGRVVG